MNNNMKFSIIFTYLVCLHLDLIFCGPCSQPDSFQCNDGECIPKSYVCNKIVDCKDASDETGDCDEILCKSPKWYRCKDNATCLRNDFLCDHSTDCPGGDDEEHCFFVEYVAVPAVNDSCDFRCHDNMCVQSNMVCDGTKHCLDGEDEDPTICDKFRKTCNGFRCDNHVCLDSAQWTCDGINDCGDNSDEQNCPGNCKVEKGFFQCPRRNLCIPLEKACDGKNDCEDNSDELGKCLGNTTCDINCPNGKCQMLPTGPVCACSKGYLLNQTSNVCEDIDECSIYGTCSQGCTNMDGSYKCQCIDKFDMNRDFKTCTAQYRDALMLFSSNKTIFSYKISSMHINKIAGNLKKAIGVCFDGQHVYWTEVTRKTESIVRIDMRTGYKEVILTAGLGSPEDVTVDYFTGNIYFTDSAYSHIAVCTNDGFYCTILINDKIHRPRALALHPRAGKMYWTDWGNKTYIGVSGMDGSNAGELVSDNVNWPNGLALDWPNNRLYWSDAKKRTIESIKLDGSDRRVVLQDVLKHPYGISVFEDRLYWSDRDLNNIQSCNKFTGKHRQIEIHDKDVYDLHIYHPALHSSEDHACLHSNCSHICLLSMNGSYSCNCPQTMALGPDLHNCELLKKTYRILIGFSNFLIDMPHQTFGRHKGTYGEGLRIRVDKVAFDSVNNQAIIADNLEKAIYALNMKTKSLGRLVSSHIMRVSDIAYDYLANTVYWCDDKKGTVEVYSINTKVRTVIIHYTGSEKPIAIELSPLTGDMFIVQQSNENTHIDKYSMTGNEPHVHLVEDDISSSGIFQLAADEKNKVLYWSDSKAGMINSISFNGRKRSIFNSNVRAPVSLALIDNEIYWIGSNSKNMYFTNKRNIDSAKKITIDSPPRKRTPSVIPIAPRVPLKVSEHPCTKGNGGCSHICVSNGPTSRTCLCPLTHQFSDKDNTTCESPKACEFKCRNGECIEYSLKCNNQKNCHDGSDEEDCDNVPVTCSWYQFKCLDERQCISNNLRCNGHPDCNDKSDEKNCPNNKSKIICPEHQFQCEEGRCLDLTAVCDGVNDCENGNDEKDCSKPIGERSGCGKDMFQCDSGQCLPTAWECDGISDCVDESDEHDKCKVTSCPIGFINCNGKTCINVKLRCDGHMDCSDNSDEIGCVTEKVICPDDQFQCSSNSSICLTEDLRCNGVPDCPRGEDEQTCSGCLIEEFECENKHCIRKEYVCDGENDCKDGSDEKNCNKTTINIQVINLNCDGKFQCGDGSCVELFNLCDGTNHCANGADEGGLCNSSCVTNNPCKQRCKKTPKGPTCGCDDGFKLQSDKKTCSDINECIEETPCSQLCDNKIGSYTCSCYDGFMLTSDKISCKSVGNSSYLLINSFDQVRKFTSNPVTLDVLWKSNGIKIMDMAMDIERNLFYFIMEGSDSLFELNLNNMQISSVSEMGEPSLISLDWVTGNVYIVNTIRTHLHTINICNMHQKACIELFRMKYKDDVRAITVDPINKFLFIVSTQYLIFNTPTTTIYKSNLDGSKMTPIYKSSSIISGLDFDPDKSTLYLTDLLQKTIIKIKYDGSSMKNLLEKDSAVFQPISISVFENHAYVLNVGSNVAGKCKLFGDFSCSQFDVSVFNAEKILIIQESKQRKTTNSCDDLKCSILCIPAPKGPTCLCQTEDGLSESDCDDSAKIGRFQKITSTENESSSNTAAILWSIFAVILVASLALFGYFMWYRRVYNRGAFSVSMYFNNPELKSDLDDSALKIHPPIPSVRTGFQHNEIVVADNLYNMCESRNYPSLNDFSDDENQLHDAESCQTDDPKQRLIV